MPTTRTPTARWRGRLAAGVVATAAAAVCTAAPAGAAVNAINPLNHPTTIAGATNGRLPSTALGPVTTTCMMGRNAVGSLSGMILAAKHVGVTLVPAACYRDYAGQVFWRTWWCSHALCGNAAIPGTSNHGWGKAVDLHDASGGLPTTSAAYRWLMANAGRYGFNHPAGVNESWHWEWVGDGGTMRGTPIRPDLSSWPMAPGIKGGDVVLLQQALIRKGVPLAYGVDGSFGPATPSAVRTFQYRYGLPVSGLVGTPSATKLDMFR